MNLSEQVEQSLFALKNPALMHDLLAQEQIIQYLMLIEKWNKRYNLTAIKTVEDMLHQHIMDSLSVINHLYGPVIVDVGTGAGLPGIPIAIARPDWQVILIESNQKKTAFLQQVKIELKLDNIAIMPQRIENTSIKVNIDTIVCRAYASLGTFIQSTRHLISSQNNQCRWIAMKSNCAVQELTEVTTPFFVENTVPLIVPGLSAKRELIIIRQSTKPVAEDQE
ncbi:MAG: 16S rRNA (guanine(527)-N(7))-methyltransferase RsmG [Nitrosomonas sp.]|nr:16S rRNA (guanine(527)-N(7))-methyltransferase RsmG [Nitrosomonas sp.]